MFSKNERLTWENLADIYKKDALFFQPYVNILKRIFLNKNNAANRSFLISSAVDQEGKTTTAVNLAISLANMGKKTLLVDANLRKPMIGEFFGINSSPGLADILIDNRQKIMINQDRFFSNLYLLCTSTVETSSLEMFLSQNFQSFWEEIKLEYEFIIVDSSSVNKNVDPLILGKFVDGVVIVVKYDKTQKRDIIMAIDHIQKNQGKIVGIILNKVPKCVPSFYRI